MSGLLADPVIRFLAQLTLTSLLMVGCGGGAANSTHLSSDAAYTSKELNYLKSLAQSNQFSGAVLVVVGGQVILRPAFGSADSKSGRPNQPDTRFRIGSITKAFTATALMLMVQDGIMKLDDSACIYLEQCPAAWRSVTVRQLLTHTSGIPDYLPVITLQQFNAPTPPQQLLALVTDRPLAFPPGSGYGYSNTNYILLGLIIEHLSGMSYGAFLDQRIFTPLGMTGTGYEREFGTVPGSAIGYGYKTRTTTEAIPTDEAAFSDGGLYSTVDDLLRFDQALADHRLLSQALERQMFSPWGGAVGGFPSRDDIGLGWLLKQDKYGHPVVYHGGMIPGYSAAIERYLASAVTTVVLSNFYWADSIGIATVLADEAPSSQ